MIFFRAHRIAIESQVLRNDQKITNSIRFHPLFLPKLARSLLHPTTFTADKLHRPQNLVSSSAQLINCQLEERPQNI